MVGWLRRFHPLLHRWSCSVSVGLRVSLLLPFQCLPAPGKVCLCWCLLLPSSFAFPSSCPCSVFFISRSFSSHFHSPFHPHFHVIRPDLNCPTLLRCVCVCVKHLNRCKTSNRKSRGQQPMTVCPGQRRPDSMVV